MVLCADPTWPATTFGRNNPSNPSRQLYFSCKNGPKRFLGTTHVRRLIRKCVTIAIFAKKNRTLLITPDRSCTQNAGWFNRRQNRKRVTYYSIQCDLPETSWFNVITQIAIALSCTISTQSNIYNFTYPSIRMNSVSISYLATVSL